MGSDYVPLKVLVIERSFLEADFSPLCDIHTVGIVIWTFTWWEMGHYLEPEYIFKIMFRAGLFFFLDFWSQNIIKESNGACLKSGKIHNQFT